MTKQLHSSNSSSTHGRNIPRERKLYLGLLSFDRLQRIGVLIYVLVQSAIVAALVWVGIDIIRHEPGVGAFTSIPVFAFALLGLRYAYGILTKNFFTAPIYPEESGDRRKHSYGYENMKRPVGIWFAALWFLIRGGFGLWGGIRLAFDVQRGFGSWHDAFFAVLFEGVIWLWCAFALWLRWNPGRIVSILWLLISTVWSSYGFYAYHLRPSHINHGKPYLFLFSVVVNLLLAYLLAQREAAQYCKTSESP